MLNKTYCYANFEQYIFLHVNNTTIGIASEAFSGWTTKMTSTF